MKTKTIFSSLLLFLLLLSSCGKTPTEKDIRENLNGYWIISQVEFESGKAKDFTYSTNVDYIEIDENLEGFRMKMQPQIDDTFLSSGNVENFTVEQRNDSLFLNYSTPMDNWSETLLSMNKDAFTVKNRQGKVYKYKRFTSLSEELDAHGK